MYNGKALIKPSPRIWKLELHGMIVLDKYNLSEK